MKGHRKTLEVENTLLTATEVSTCQEIGGASEKASMERTKTPVSQTTRPPSTTNEIHEVGEGIAEVITKMWVKRKDITLKVIK